MSGRDTPASTAAEILRQLWRTLAPPLGTEAGAIVALLATAVAGMAAGLVVVVVLGLLLPYLRPTEGLVRATVLVAGPPLRYALLLVAVGKTWLAPEQGLVPALILLLVLAFVVPLVGFLVAQAIARRDRSA